ncbi:MAG: hypothetical protein IJH25_02220 [Clostridia bacterium]|nr:hypothetical protein [Clostridia bacterium]MBQ6120582.1 hypothetical protein [Clostridia bacterium]
MKRFVSVILALMLLLTYVAFAEADYASMSDGELHALIDGARHELTKRELIAGEKLVLIDQDGVTLYLTGENRMSGDFTYMQAVLINDNDFPVLVTADQFAANGWDVWCGGFDKTEANKKKKSEITFKSVDAEISDLSELEDIEVTFTIKNGDDYKAISSTEHLTIHFNAE